jgi:hypothetical protein
MAVSVAALPVLAGWGPCGPIPGGRIDGEPAGERVADWTFTDELSTIQVETKPGEPYSVTTWCITDGPNLYVPSRGAPEKPWVKNVVADPRVRARIGDRVHQFRAVRVVDGEEQRRVVSLLRRKYTMARWGMDEDPSKAPDTWYFRMEQ